MSTTRSSTELVELPLARAAELVEDGDVSPVELVDACIERIERRNPRINALIDGRERDTGPRISTLSARQASKSRGRPPAQGSAL